jgi:electron transport complex protein RnfG
LVDAIPMKDKLSILISGALLGLFGILGAGLVGFSQERTAERIEDNQRQALLSQLGALVPSDSFDNDMVTDVIEVSDLRKLGTETTRVYRAKREGQIVALVLSPVVTQGYSGPMQLIVGVRRDGTLAGVRVLTHKETPGLGDKIEVERSDWILGFRDRSLVAPPASRWQVKRDGGDFDQFTGATITPRAVVQGVKSALEFVRSNEVELFGKTTAAEEKGDE